MNKTLIKYQNGNSVIELFEDGTRVITTESDDFEFDTPLNVDIRVNTGCSLGFNPKTNKTVCSFCHESARTDGKECDYEKLKEVLKNLPSGTELAIGGNKLTEELTKFLVWSKKKGFICNLTVNHLHINLNDFKLKFYLEEGLIKGLGISYRKDHSINFDDYFMNHPNVFLLYI